MTDSSSLLTATEAERALAGAALVYPERTTALLDSAGFDHSQMAIDFFRFLVAHIRGAVGKREPVDFVSVATAANMAFPGLSTGKLTDTTEHVGDGSRVPVWAQAVKDCYLRREAIHATSSHLDALRTPADIGGTLGAMRSWLDGQQALMAPAKSFHLRDIIDGALESLGSDEPHDARILRTGLRELDEKMTLEQTDLLVIGGATGSGKSMLGLNIAMNILTDPKGKGSGLFVSLEMSVKQVGERILSRYSHTPGIRLKKRMVTEGDLLRISRAALEVAKVPLIVRDDCHELHKILAAARALHSSSGLRVLVVDYLQLVRGPEAELREQQVAQVSRELRLLALETGALVIALAQLNRQGEARESQAIMMDATQFVTVRAVDTEGRIFSAAEEESELDESRRRIDIGKQRDGGPGNVLVGFEGAESRFYDLPENDKNLAKHQRRGPD